MPDTHLINAIPFLGIITRKNGDTPPTLTKWIEILAPVGGVAVWMYVSIQVALGHIADNKEAIAKAEAHIQQTNDRQDEIMRDVSKRIDSIQTMLAIEISKKK